MEINGKLIDLNGRCEHYHGEHDTVNIKFKCCEKFYACIYCHNEAATHKTETWTKAEFEEKAIHCGNCDQLLTIKSYLENDSCVNCKKRFNPNCEKHYKYYFDIN